MAKLSPNLARQVNGLLNGLVSNYGEGAFSTPVLQQVLGYVMPTKFLNGFNTTKLPAWDKLVPMAPSQKPELDLGNLDLKQLQELINGLQPEDPVQKKKTTPTPV